MAITKLVLAAALASALLCAQALGQVQTAALPVDANPFIGTSLACSQARPTEKIIVPSSHATRDTLRARLLNLLRESLYDDAKGIVNIAREKEIKKLANKIRKEE